MDHRYGLTLRATAKAIEARLRSARGASGPGAVCAEIARFAETSSLASGSVRHRVDRYPFVAVVDRLSRRVAGAANGRRGGGPLTAAKGSRARLLFMRRPSRYLTCLLPIFIALLLAGCGEQTATSATKQVLQQQEERIEAAFRHQFQKQFNERVHEVAQVCHNEGAGQGGEQNWTCEGWGVANSGNCLLVTVEATITSLPTLEGKEVTPGTEPFAPGSCKIGGR
jgi:hypothetical protein